MNADAATMAVTRLAVACQECGANSWVATKIDGDRVCWACGECGEIDCRHPAVPRHSRERTEEDL